MRAAVPILLTSRSSWSPQMMASCLRPLRRLTTFRAADVPIVVAVNKIDVEELTRRRCVRN